MEFWLREVLQSLAGAANLSSWIGLGALWGCLGIPRALQMAQEHPRALQSSLGIALEGYSGLVPELHSHGYLRKTWELYLAWRRNR